MTEPLPLGDRPTRVQVVDALQDGLITPRQAGGYFPELLTLAESLGLDVDQTLDLPDLPEDEDDATLSASLTTAASDPGHATSAPAVAVDDVGDQELMVPRLTAEQRDRAIAGLNIWYSDDDGPAPMWRQPYSRYELRAMHDALQASTLDEGFAVLDGWLADERTRDYDRGKLNELRETLPYAGPDASLDPTAATEAAAVDQAVDQAVPREAESAAASDPAAAGEPLVTDADVRMADEYNTADPQQVAWAQRERRRAAAQGLQVTLEGIDTAWDREGWRADHTDYADTQATHLDGAASSSDTDGLTA